MYTYHRITHVYDCMYIDNLVTFCEHFVGGGGDNKVSKGADGVLTFSIAPVNPALLMSKWGNLKVEHGAPCSGLTVNAPTVPPTLLCGIYRVT